MPSVPTKGYKLILTGRRFEDYKSMKQWFKGETNKEVICSINQASSIITALEGSDVVIGTQPTAEEIVYLKTEADDANQDGKSVWVVYQDSTGAIHGPIVHLLAAAAEAGTEVIHALGNEGVIDVVDGAPVAGAVTMTALNPGLDAYKGLYLVVYSGDQIGVSSIILTNSVDDPTVITTLKADWNANLAADSVQIQEFPCSDFMRMREMYCEVEPNDDAQILIGDADLSPIYGAIAEDSRYSSHSGYFVPDSATCRSFLGQIKGDTGQVYEGDAADAGSLINITFTPLEAHVNGGSADITMQFQFSKDFNWEPCIELEPATDVLVSISDITTPTIVHIEMAILEVYPPRYTGT